MKSDIRFHKSLYVETGKLKGFKYVGVQDRALKLYPSSIVCEVPEYFPNSKYMLTQCYWIQNEPHYSDSALATSTNQKK